MVEIAPIVGHNVFPDSKVNVPDDERRSATCPVGASAVNIDGVAAGQ